MLLQWWGHHVWRYLAIDDYLNSMLYPFVGSVTGALAGVGLASGLASNGQRGLGWVVAVLVIIFVASGGPALLRRSQAGVPKRFSLNDVERDLNILASRVCLSATERRIFEMQETQDRLEGERMIKEADLWSWNRYWNSRGRWTRFLALGWLMPAAGSAGAFAWLSGSPWLLVTALSGNGLLIALDARRRLDRNRYKFEGSLLVEAADEMRVHLERLETEPDPLAGIGPGFLLRLAFLLTGHWRG